MAVDWRAIFADIRVEYVERGPNTSRRNINVSCPWCGGDDPSHHLSVSRTEDAYYCYRNSEHRGRDPIRLLTAFGLPRRDAIEVYNRNAVGEAPKEEPRPELDEVRKLWAKLRPADEDPEIEDYLYDRGFRGISQLVDTYDLRCASHGRHARRVLIPITDGTGEMVSWTGRAIRSDMQPRYLMQEINADGLIYLPRTMRRVGIIVEGPFDALKIAAATEGENVSPAALLGTANSEDRLSAIAAVCRVCTVVLIAQDRGMEARSRIPLCMRLRSMLRIKNVYGIDLPDPARGVGYKDPGEMSYEDVRSWIRTKMQEYNLL